MAITLTSNDLIQPKGELSHSYFPDNDLSTQITGWLAKAVQKVNANTDIASSVQNDAVEAWVYYLAYSHIANSLAAMPNSVNVNDGADSVSYAQDRPAYWRLRAEAQRTLYSGFVVPVTATVTPRTSFGIPTRAVW